MLCSGASVLVIELVKGLSQNGVWVSEKVWMWCESVANVTDLSVLTAPVHTAACGFLSVSSALTTHRCSDLILYPDTVGAD